MTMLATRAEVVERLRISRRTFDVHAAQQAAEESLSLLETDTVTDTGRG